MFALIVEADVGICDITVHNANVFYELGIRNALRKKHTVLIKGDPTSDKTPFDLSTDRYLKYSLDDQAAALDDLVATITPGLTGPRETDSRVSQLLPHLAEADPSEVTVVPLELPRNSHAPKPSPRRDDCGSSPRRCGAKDSTWTG